MKKIIDSNFLRDPRLSEYLSSSTRNMAVITDYACMELYKGKFSISVPKSMEIVSRFPSQVIVLKGTMAIGALSGRTAGLARRMISRDQTEEFQAFCIKLDEIRNGSGKYDAAMAEHGRVAAEHMEIMLHDASTLQETFRDVVRELFTRSEVEVIRTGNEYTASIIQKILRTTLLMATDLMKHHPHGVRLPPGNEMPNTFIFRFALCSVILVLRWVEGGGQLQTKPERVRNDMVDVSFAAYGTYFDGIMTNDRKMLSIFYEASFILKEVTRR